MAGWVALALMSTPRALDTCSRSLLQTRGGAHAEGAGGYSEVPESIRRLALDLFGEIKAKDVLSKVATQTTRLNGNDITLHAFQGDDALVRLPSEFSNNVYGVNALSTADGKDPVVDIGANLGTFSMAAFLKNPKLRILALEPMPITYFFLRWNLEANGIPVISKQEFFDKNAYGVLAINAGATSDSRAISIKYDPAKSENGVALASSKIPTTSDITTGHEIATSNVTSINVAKFIADGGVSNLSFFKIDCEGCEHEVVPTLTKLIQNSKYVGAEIHPCLPGQSCLFSRDQVQKTKQIMCDFGRCCLEVSEASLACSAQAM